MCFFHLPHSSLVKLLTLYPIFRSGDDNAKSSESIRKQARVIVPLKQTHTSHPDVSEAVAGDCITQQLDKQSTAATSEEASMPTISTELATSASSQSPHPTECPPNKVGESNGCSHCFQKPWVMIRKQTFLGHGKAACLANVSMRHEIYKNYSKILINVGLWRNMEYL